MLLAHESKPLLYSVPVVQVGGHLFSVTDKKKKGEVFLPKKDGAQRIASEVPSFKEFPKRVHRNQSLFVLSS